MKITFAWISTKKFQDIIQPYHSYSSQKSSLPGNATDSSITKMTSLWIHKRASVRSRSRAWLAGSVVVYLLCVIAVLKLRAWGSSPVLQHGDVLEDEITGVHRVKRDAGDLTLNGKNDVLGAVNEENETCTPRAVDNFPGNFLSLRDTKDGGVFLHILLALYLFAALAIVCDDYFVPSLEIICQDLGLQEDVAGATFMAAGSSAPELCTSIVGVFIAQSDVGVGTIVGSAVFNILCIIGLCGIFAGMVVQLTWFPLLRDTLFYLLSVLTLVLVINDSVVHWYEAFAMLLLYCLYILLMYFNRRLEERALEAMDNLRARWGLPPSNRGPVSEQEDPEKQALLGNGHANNGRPSNGSAAGGGKEGGDGITEIAETSFSSSGRSGTSGKDKDEEYESPWTIPDRFISRVYWVAMVPVKALSFFTIPDCRRGGVWRRLYLISFIMSVVWIGAYTYIMVWMITITGDALEIPDTVMGLTLLAAGTSLPDCIASILVARDGFGDMAVSNSIGSNVFDILLCLGLPWVIDTAVSGESLQISSSGLLYSSLTLLATVVFLLVSVAANRWRLTKGYGGVCLVVYVAVIALSSLYELNVFADLNPPSCPR